VHAAAIPTVANTANTTNISLRPRSNIAIPPVERLIAKALL